MCQAVHIMKRLNVIGVIVAITIIALTGIAMVVAAAAPLLVQSASATNDGMDNSTSLGSGGQEAVNSTTTSDVTNALLGRLFMTVEFETASVNPINET
jgi:acid phosphatase class B